MKIKKIIASLLCFASVIPCLATASFAVADTAVTLKSEERIDMSAEIVVKGGAKAVFSMTYDDGSYDTAVWMNEMFEKYGLKASCMLITDKQNLASKEWQVVFEKGYLSPENHSATHLVMPAPGWSSGTGIYYEDRKDNNVPENYQKEILDSKTYLEKTFNRPNLTFAPSNNTLWWEAVEVVKANYYAMRQGNRGNASVVQSISPTEGSDEKGGWYNPYMYGIDNASLEEMQKYVQACIDKGGWFISMTHAVVNDAEKQARYTEFYKYLSEKRIANDIWVTTFQDATIYLREKQNSEVSAYATSEGVFVRIKMNDTTGDGLPLSSDIFNMPLTVKTEVPKSWSVAAYELDGETCYANTFSEGGKNYAYIDVAPNKPSAKVRGVEFCEVSQNPVIAGYIEADGEFVQGDMLVSAYTEKFRVGENVKVYAKIPTSSFTENTVAALPIKVEENAAATLNIYGINDPTAADSWSKLTINPYNAPSNNPLAILGDGVQLITSIVVNGKGTYIADISAYAEEIKSAGGESCTVIITLDEESSAKKLAFSFGTASDVPEGSGYTKDFIPYNFTADFENASGAGGFVTGGIGSNEKNSFKVEETEGYTGEITKCIAWKSTRNYERNFLLKVLSEDDSLSEADIGSEYRITFRLKASAQGTFAVYLGNSKTKPTPSKLPASKVYTFDVSKEDVGKWIKYTCTFTIDADNIETDPTAGGQHTSLAFNPKAFAQSPDEPVWLYIDDIMSTKVNTGAKSPMIPTEYKALTTSDGALYVGGEINTVEDKKFSYLVFEKPSVRDSVATELRLKISKTNSERIKIYALSGVSVSGDMSFATAPGIINGEVDTSKVYLGIPIFDGVAEYGELSVDIENYLKSTEGQCVFLIACDDISERELIYYDFSTIPVSAEIDYTAVGTVTKKDGKLSVSGSLSFEDILAGAQYGDECTVSAYLTKGATLTVGTRSVTAKLDGEVSIKLKKGTKPVNATVFSDSEFTLDDFSVRVTNSPVKIAKDAKIISSVPTEYDFSVITPHISLALSNSLEFWVYINKLPDVSYFASDYEIYEGDELSALDIRELGGEEYYVVRVPVSYADLVNEVHVSLGVRNKDGNLVKKTYSYSPCTYIETLLSDTKYEAEKSLLLDILSYARAGVRYEDNAADTSEINKILYNHSYFDNVNECSDKRVFTPDKTLIESVLVSPCGGLKIVFTPAEKYCVPGASVEFDIAGFVLDAEQSADGTYILTLPVHLAKSRITLTLKDADGNTASTEYNLNYSIADTEDAYLAAALSRLARCSDTAEKYKAKMAK